MHITYYIHTNTTNTYSCSSMVDWISKFIKMSKFQKATYIFSLYGTYWEKCHWFLFWKILGFIQLYVSLQLTLKVLRQNNKSLQIYYYLSISIFNVTLSYPLFRLCLQYSYATHSHLCNFLFQSLFIVSLYTLSYLHFLSSLIPLCLFYS